MPVSALRRNPQIYWDMLKWPTQTLSGCTIVYTGISSPWLNGVVGGSPQNVEAIVTYFTEKKVPFSWWFEKTNESKSLQSELEKQEMMLLGEFSGMTLSLQNLACTQDSPLNVELVSSKSSLSQFMDVLLEVYEGPKEIAEAATQLFFQAGLQAPNYHFLGKVDAIPVSVVSLYVDTEGVASVYNMGTIAKERKKGYASYLMQCALQTVIQSQAKSSALIATPEGVALYKRLGYQSHTPFHLYMKF